MSIWHNRRLLDRYHGVGVHAGKTLNTEQFKDDYAGSAGSDDDDDDDDIPLRPFAPARQRMPNSSSSGGGGSMVGGGQRLTERSESLQSSIM